MKASRHLERAVEDYYSRRISRRGFIGRSLTLGAASAIPGLVADHFAGAAGAQTKGSGQVVVCSWGGDYAAAQKKAFFDPFEQETGIRVIVTGIPDVAKIRAMVSTKNVEWDFVDAEGEMVFALARDGMLERADYSLINKSELIPGTFNEWGIGSVAYSYIMGWNSDIFPSGKGPRGWADFFNVQQLPGRRGLYNEALPVLEFALVSDGVPMHKLYPLDVERAFKFLRAHKPAIKVWFKEMSQVPTLMRNKELDMIEGTNGFIIGSLVLKRSSVPVAYTWNQGAWLQSYWVVPKGAKNKANAMKLMAYYARGKNEAVFAGMRPSGLPNKNVYNLIPKKTADLMPTAPQNISKMFQVNADWWARNLDPVTKQWLDFVSS